MDVKENDMNDARLSLKEIMKKDMEDELIHGVKVCNLAFHFGKRLGLSYERAIELATAVFCTIWENFKCQDICMDEMRDL